MSTMMMAFEDFCEQFNLEYDFSVLGSGVVYEHSETHKAYMIFKHSYKYLMNEVKE